MQGGLSQRVFMILSIGATIALRRNQCIPGSGPALQALAGFPGSSHANSVAQRS